MAEAIKELPKQKQRNIQKSKTNSIAKDHDLVMDEITESSLEKRLKSLTSFINNLEPSAPVSQQNTEAQLQPELIEKANLPTTSKNSDQYYEMISQKAKEINESQSSFNNLNSALNELKIINDNLEVKHAIPSAPVINSNSIPRVVDFNQEQIKKINKLNYPRLNWNQISLNQTTDQIDFDLFRFYDNDQLCKDLEIYYKCKSISNEKFISNLNDFVKLHSNLNEFQFDQNNTSQHRKNEFYELLKDYFEARKLVLRCEKHINEFKWTTIAEQMNKIWSFEKYTIESYGICGDQQRCKHDLTSEKAYLNRTELNKLQSMLYEYRFNLIKNGLISSQFCSKLAKLKLESYLHEFINKFNLNQHFNNENYLNFNNQLKILIDVLFYFYRKHSKPNQTQFKFNMPDNSNNYYEIDEGSSAQLEQKEKEENREEDADNMENFIDEVFKQDVKDWIKTLSCFMLNKSDSNRILTLRTAQSQTLMFKFSTVHFENLFFILQHLLRCTQSLDFSYMIQLPFLSLESSNENILFYKIVNLNNSKSDQLINLYFDFYLSLIASFSYKIIFRQEFLGLNQKIIENIKIKSQNDKQDEEIKQSNDNQNWQFIDLEGETESIESVLIDISEDDLIKLYYQIPFNSLYSFLWFYLEYQSNDISKIKLENVDDVSLNAVDFRKSYVSMKILSFLENLSRLSIRSLLLYNRLKYKNFSKLIGKTLRDIIKFISNLVIKFNRVENLCIHYDNFIKRIFTTIIYSLRLRSIRWTILNQLNISKLNLNTKWLLLSIMCGIDVFHPNFELIFRSDLSNRPSDYIEQACQNDLESILVKDSANTTDIELLSFMRTLHFLIDLSPNETEPSLDQIEFMSSVIRVIFKIAYCYTSTQDVCYKEGNSILFAVCSVYPCLISSILKEIDTELALIGKKSLYLCSDLPFYKWLPFVDLNSDLKFIKKCLLMNLTNSILFRLCTNMIDNLNFESNTKEKSELILNKSDKFNSNLAELINFYGMIDIGQIFKIKLSIILFELHSRLTNYNYFNKALNNEEVMFELSSSSNNNFNACSNEELNQHYNKINKEKRFELVNWIWSTFYRMNLYIQIDSLRFIDYLEELSQIYEFMPKKFEPRTNMNYLTKFYQIYLTNQIRPENVLNNEESVTSLNQSQPVQLILQPKCPLESYLRLIFSSSGHNLNYAFEHSIDLIQIILNINKKHLKLNKISYLVLFDWFDSLIKVHCLSKNEQESRLEDFKLSINEHNSKLSEIVLFLFTFNNSQFKLIETYCSKLNKNLLNLKNSQQNLKIYLSIWIEIFIKSIKNWHKYKNIVKIIDFLICFSFNNLNQNQNLIDFNLLDEFLVYVRSDFGITESNFNSEIVSNDFGSNISLSGASQSSSWLQPSISWLSNSLTYVVSSTTHQLTNTVGAAIGALSSNNSEFFDSNQQNFSYDKRLYKECPYVGFYLSLCEERIETQLSIWALFRSFLLGVNDPLASTLDANPAQSNLNSISFIENCWRKTLNFVNKANSLNLNFSPQRLMLFKWCERAIELPHEHPLLILYWQKFFNIYLDKEYYSNLSINNSNHRSNSFDLELTTTGSQAVQNNTQIQSVTFKLFTSTSQLNSLLKQMKKQLELTSEHYAYKIQSNNNNSTNVQVSAPISNYHFNEFMSKLYYALSLWIDETRLHDPNLYLPALPAHYEPNLLAKIFTKQCDMWVEFIDMNLINYQLQSIINSAEKFVKNDHESVLVKNNNVSKTSTRTDLFFKQADRLVVEFPKLDELNLNFASPLKEKFGESIENLLQFDQSKSKQSSKDEAFLILNISEHLIKNVFKYNKDFINHTLNHMLKLDDKLTNKLLIHLWHNEMCEKYVQVPCSSLINPMHQCTRPAMVKFVYEVATKRDQFRHDIKENRINHDKLITNFIDLTQTASSSKFPHDDIIISMVAMSQLIKRLLRNHHIDQQSSNEETSNQFLLTKLFYLLIDIYESNMNHPNDVLNPAKSSSFSSNSNSSTNLTGWSILFKTNDSFDLLNEQFNSDSIHLFMFDLIHLIGTNFIQTNIAKPLHSHKKNNQHILLEKIIQKLTSTINITNLLENNASLSRSSSSNSTSQTNNTPQISTRRSSSILLNLTRNKLSLMSLCAQYVEPNDLDLFNEFYLNIISSINSILLNENQNATNTDPNLPSLDSTEMINQKFSIILQLLTKFSFINFNKLLKSNQNDQQIEKICKDFVDININFLSDLNLEYLTNLSSSVDEELKKRDFNLKMIINQCIENFVSILNVNYKNYFGYMLKKCLEFSSKDYSIRYGTLHFRTLVTILKQNELNNMNLNVLSKQQFESSFKYLNEFFNFEKSKFKSQKKTFYSHWSNYSRQLLQLSSTLFLIYFDKYIIKELHDEAKFEYKFDILFKQLIDLYSVWIEPSSVLEITSNQQINAKEIYQNEISSIESRDEMLNFELITSPQSSILLMIDSFLSTFHSIVERLGLVDLITSPMQNDLFSLNCKNYALNKLIHFYYEQIASVLNNPSSINDNTLDCFHICMSKYSTSFFGGLQFEPDYRSINIMNELCSGSSYRPVKYLAYNLVCYFDLNRITESYFRKVEIKPIQINDLLKCILKLLSEFCLRDPIRESIKFDLLLRPIYNQAEVLQCWSMLSDQSYSSVLIERFLPVADYRYAFASRGTDKGLLMNLLKSAAEFYSLADRNSLSCFSSAKRRCFLKCVCELLLKPSVQTIKNDLDSFQNCIMNLLTDIETFSISAGSNQEDCINNNKSLNHEIQLLIDECLCLISSGQNLQLNEIYLSMFESWLSSSKDSPILVHFINRISKNYNLLMLENSHDRYCNLLELCIEVYFETNRDNYDIEKLVLLNQVKNEASISWKCLMDEIDFIKLTPNQQQENELFEFKLLKNSSYLLLNCYMSQRFALLKASCTTSIDFYQESLNYTQKLINSFFNPNQLSKPKQFQEEKFIVVLNKLIDFYLNCLYNINSSSVENKIGEQLVRLSNLLIYYGEDTLSAQNPTNDGQSLGSDLLASIGLNILSKKSQYSIKFRFFCRSISICLLKQILFLKESDLDLNQKSQTEPNDLFPNLNVIKPKTDFKSDKLIYKIKMSHTDVLSENEPVNFNNKSYGHLSPTSSNSNLSMLSTSLPNNFNQEQSSIVNSYNQLLKQAAYHFHLLFQTKAYTNFSEINLNELANYVNQNLTQTQSQYFCFQQCFNLSKYLCAKLFCDKYYLF